MTVNILKRARLTNGNKKLDLLSMPRNGFIQLACCTAVWSRDVELNVLRQMCPRYPRHIFPLRKLKYEYRTNICLQIDTFWGKDRAQYIQFFNSVRLQHVFAINAYTAICENKKRETKRTKVHKNYLRSYEKKYYNLLIRFTDGVKSKKKQKCPSFC